MRAWIETLEARERLFVFIGAAFVVCALVYFLVWAPLERKHSNLALEVTDWETSLAAIKPLGSRIASSSNGRTANVQSVNRTPIIIVDETLRQRGLDRYRKRSQPTSSNGIRVEFEDVSFDDLMLWLGDLSEQHGMQVQAASFSRGGQAASGRIKANLTLERAL